MSESDHGHNINDKSPKSFSRNSSKMKSSSPSLVASKTEFHPTLVVSNIKNHISLFLRWRKTNMILRPNFSAFMPVLNGFCIILSLLRTRPHRQIPLVLSMSSGPPLTLTSYLICYWELGQNFPKLSRLQTFVAHDSLASITSMRCLALLNYMI